MAEGRRQTAEGERDKERKGKKSVAGCGLALRGYLQMHVFEGWNRAQ
jgi:hypothetical protein